MQLDPPELDGKARNSVRAVLAQRWYTLSDNCVWGFVKGNQVGHIWSIGYQICPSSGLVLTGEEPPNSTAPKKNNRTDWDLQKRFGRTPK